MSPAKQHTLLGLITIAFMPRPGHCLWGHSSTIFGDDLAMLTGHFFSVDGDTPGVVTGNIFPQTHIY